MTVIILDPAEDVLEQIFHWYEQQQSELGLRFLVEFEKSVERIRDFPGSNAKVYRNFRIAQPRKCPYGIFYFVGSENIFVQSIIY
jgi:plasmid stabilization system protein ParE